MIPSLTPGEPVALGFEPGVGAALAPINGKATVLSTAESLAVIRQIENDIGPRWVWWSKATAKALIINNIRPARCWDLAAVQRLIFGGWQTNAASIWAATRDLDPERIPKDSPVDLFTALEPDDDPENPIRLDGYLRPDWVDGQWSTTPPRIGRWTELAASVYNAQIVQLDDLQGRPRALATARSESAAELLAAELEHDGLPIDIGEAERVIADYIGPKPLDAAAERAQVAARDKVVLDHLPAGHGIDLRNPSSVKSLLRRVGIEVADTRASTLERRRDEHPVLDALLDWRKAERIATTFGYGWLDRNVGADGRLRGEWSGADGAAGRMTATAGLHNMPSELRPGIVAPPGRIFVRADLGQIEPRVLAAVSDDHDLALATHDADMYAPVARRLRVEREVAKVAVLGAMYGQTTGLGAAALQGLESAYPKAMEYLRTADVAAQGGHNLRTVGGRCVKMNATGTVDMSDRAARSRAAARGRFGRNAMVQGAAAEFFKTWAVTVRARCTHGVIVLCLHDELLLDVPETESAVAAQLVEQCLQEAAHRWAPPTDGPIVQFVADISEIVRWSDAK